MRIKSKFSDYYDYVAHLYGGGDPSILYLRKRLIDVPVGTAPDCVTIDQRGILNTPNLSYSINPIYQTKWLTVCGRYYLLLRNIDPKRSRDNLASNWEIIDPILHPKPWDQIFNNKNYLGYGRTITPNNYIGGKSDELIELCKKVGAPVFTFVKIDKNKIYVDPVIPILGDLNFHKFFSPEQMYQELAYFIVNTMKDSPDMMPPTAMSDKEKISQHGFDLKQSFRHRK